MRHSKRRRSALVARGAGGLLAAILAGSPGCGRSDAPEVAPVVDSLRGTMAPPAPAGGGEPSEVDVAPPDSSGAAPRTYRMLLVNGRAIDALVYADGGAGRVLLDTVPAGDSVRVDVRVRASRLELEAEDARGVVLGAGAVDLDPGGLSRWELPAPAGGPSDVAPGPIAVARARDGPPAACTPPDARLCSGNFARTLDTGSRGT